MSEPNQFVASADHELANTGVTPNASGVTSFRSVPSTSQTPVVAPSPPMLPQRPDMSNMAMQAYGGMNQGYGYGSMGYGMGGMGMGSYGGLGGYGGYSGGYGMGGMGGMGMGMNPYGYNNRPYGDVESRFIQLAEENSRPAFDSIQSLVTAVGSVAMMLENTFFALTSSFRAILGVAENFGRLRSLFAQFWSALGVVRALNWLIRRLLVLIGVRTEAEFKAWSEAVAASRAPPVAGSRASGWPVVLFFGVVAAAPYIILRMMSSMTTAIHDRLNDPTTWQNPLRAVAEHDFQATTPQEISFNANQVLTLAPQHLQGNLWNSGWVMASTDRQTAGLVPVNYIKVVKPSDSEKQNVTEKEPERQEL